MPKRTTLTTLKKAGPLVVAVLSMAVLGAGFAQAQYYYGGRQPPPPPPQRGGGFFPFFAPFQRPMAPLFGGQPAPGPAPDRPADFSRAPAAKKLETQPERHIVVLGDAMADWLAYGLEDAYAETQDLGVVRKHRTISGLIRYQPRGAPEDWVAAAKDILANEKPSAVLIMLGLNDRQAIREPVAPVPAAKGAKPDASKPDANKPAAGQEAAKPDTAKPESSEEQTAEAAKSPDDEDEQPSIIAPERTTKGAGGMHEFRSEKWVELYKKKIADMIAVARMKGVPVLWVGLPAVRGQRAMSDVLLLNSLYREEASKAGITYVDVWDGFVDERGVFLSSGPDVDGQTRRLRSGDNVYFTKAGARKLAHYAERELSRLVLNRAMPVALPSDPGQPDLSGRPGPRPLAGPIVPLTASSVGTTELLGGAGSRPANVDALAARTLVKGEPLAPPSGRADDFAWPRRDVGIPAPESILAAPSPSQTPAPTPAVATAPAAPAVPVAPQRARPAAQRPDAAAQPLQPGQPSQPRAQQPRRPSVNDGAPRPPAPVGPSAQAPARNWFGWR